MAHPDRGREIADGQYAFNRFSRQILRQSWQSPVRNGGKGVIQARGTPANGDEKAQKHPDRRHDRFGATNAARPSPFEDKRSECPRRQALWLVPKHVEHGRDRQPVAVEGRLSRPAVGLHPLTKGSKQCRLRWGWEDRGRRGHDPCRLEEADQVTRSHKQVAIAATGMPQALDPLEVMTIRLKGLHIQRLHAETCAVGPAREAMCASQQMEDAA